MALPGDVKEREYKKFVESPTRPNETAIEVIQLDSSFGPPANCDFIERSVLGSVETYKFRQGGALGTILKTVVVTYTDASLESLLTVVES